MMFCPFGACIIFGMDAPTRGCAPGYDVLPLRGDRSARTTSPPMRPFHRLKSIAPRPNGRCPEGAKDPSPGRSPGTQTGPIFINFYAPKGRRMSAESVPLGTGPPPRPEGAQDISPGRSPGTQTGPIFTISPEGAQDIGSGRSPGPGPRAAPFLPILTPGTGATRIPMCHLGAMGYLL